MEFGVTDAGVVRIVVFRVAQNGDCDQCENGSAQHAAQAIRIVTSRMLLAGCFADLFRAVVFFFFDFSICVLLVRYE